MSGDRIKNPAAEEALRRIRDQYYVPRETYSFQRKRVAEEAPAPDCDAQCDPGSPLLDEIEDLRSQLEAERKLSAKVLIYEGLLQEVAHTVEAGTWQGFPGVPYSQCSWCKKKWRAKDGPVPPRHNPGCLWPRFKAALEGVES